MRGSQVSEAMAGVGSADNAFAQLNRFEQTVTKEEATAKAFDQLRAVILAERARRTRQASLAEALLRERKA